VLNRLAVGPGDGLHATDPGHAEDCLGDFVDDQEVRGVAQIVIAFDHEHLGVHPRLREVPIRGGVTLIRGQIGG
jgi:hypothetical protein